MGQTVYKGLLPEDKG